MEEVDKGCRMIRLGVSGWVFLWHQPTRVVPDQQTLNCCVCTVLSHVRLITSLLSHFFNILYQIAISATTLHTFNDPLSGTTWVSQYQKGKNNLDLNEARGSGINWAICKSAPHSRQTTTSAPHLSIFYRPDAPPATQPTVSKHCPTNTII